MKKIIHPTVLKKDITRFSPLWVLYTVFMLLALVVLWESETDAARFMNTAPYVMGSMTVVNFFYAGIAVLLLFSDLFSTRMANMLHALPVRREGLFFTHLTAGILFCLVPNLLGCLITAAMLGQYAYGAFLWLAVTVLGYLFFFGVGVFSVMCAGNALGAISMYGIVNFLTVLAGWLVVVFYEPALYGMEIDLNALSQLSPVVGMSNFTYLDTDFDNMTGITTVHEVLTGEWIYLAVAALVGLGLMTAALFIYRKRDLETAGDFISFQYVSPVFLGIYTLLAAALIYIVGREFSDTLGSAFLVIGMVIGFFTGRMLLEKQIRVFGKKNLLTFVVAFAVFLGSLGLTVLDPVGITRYVPEAEEVKWVRVSPYGTAYSLSNQGCTLAEKEDIQAILELHELALKSRYADKLDSIPLHLQYRLENGTTVERTYHIPEDPEAMQVLQSFYSRPESVLGTREPLGLLVSIEQVEFYPYEDSLPFLHMSRQDDGYSAEEKFGGVNPVVHIVEEGGFGNSQVAKGLLEAVLADCEAGTMSQWQANPVGHLYIALERGGYWEYLEIAVNAESTHTLTYLKSLITE